MRYAYKKKILFGGVILVTLFIILHPKRNGLRSFEHIKKDDILDSLHEEVSANLSSIAVIECDYRDTIEDDTTLSIGLVDGDLIEGHGIREGGEYAPQDCKPKFSSAIIVPYRDRPEQLRGFLVYMHTYFRRQKIHYRIYVIEQVDSRPFNRAKLLNIGAVAAMKAGYPCLILHDIDILPLKPANIYACTNQPRHMSSNVHKFRCLKQKSNHIAEHHSKLVLCFWCLFVLPYLKLIGGVVAITSKQYKAVNGMSNEYFGCGGEDDDFYLRLEANNIKVCRFEPVISRYHMISHTPKITGNNIKKLLSDAKSRISTDGLKTLKYAEVATVLHPLFTHIMVDL